MYIIYRLNLKTEESTEFITQRPCAVAPEDYELRRPVGFEV